MSILKNLYGYMFLFILALFSCKKELPKREEKAGRTVMVYMAANNNLANEAYENINQMETAFKNVEGNLLVYVKLKNENPAIYKIKHDETASIKSQKLKTYENHNSVAPETMKGVIADMQTLAPSSSYGLVLWSHASSWLPPKKQVSGYTSTQSFGDDEDKEMDLLDLAAALPNHLDYILFDACYMASIEVLYQLRNKSKYLLASPSEVIASGMPYHLITPYLFTQDLKNGLTQAAKTYFDFYKQKQGLYQSATIALVDASQLENLAMQTTNFINTQQKKKLARNGVQRMDFLTNPIIESFDFMDSFQKNFPEASTTSLAKAMNQAVIYKANTPNFNGQKINAYSGISIYIPTSISTINNEYYQNLDWFKIVAYHLVELT